MVFSKPFTAERWSSAPCLSEGLNGEDEAIDARSTPGRRVRDHQAADCGPEEFAPRSSRPASSNGELLVSRRGALERPAVAMAAPAAPRILQSSLTCDGMAAQTTQDSSLERAAARSGSGPSCAAASSSLLSSSLSEAVRRGTGVVPAQPFFAAVIRCSRCGGSGMLRLDDQRYRTCMDCLGRGHW